MACCEYKERVVNSSNGLVASAVESTVRSAYESVTEKIEGRADDDLSPPGVDSRLSQSELRAQKKIVDYPRPELDAEKKIVDYLRNDRAAEKR